MNMSLNFASVIQSDSPLTQNLYSEEFMDVKNTNKKDNFREAVDMEKYHTEMYNQQLEESKKKRMEVEKDAAKRVADYNIASKKIKQRYQEFLDKHKNDGWNGFENHWYWKYYFNNIDKIIDYYQTIQNLSHMSELSNNETNNRIDNINKAITFNKNEAQVYINGNYKLTKILEGRIKWNTGDVYINNPIKYSGKIENLRYLPGTISSSIVQQLYQEK